MYAIQNSSSTTYAYSTGADSLQTLPFVIFNIQTNFMSASSFSTGRKLPTSKSNICCQSPMLCPKQDWLDVCTFHAKQVLFQLHAKSIQTFIKIDGSPDLSYNFSTCENLNFINKISRRL